MEGVRERMLAWKGLVTGADGFRNVVLPVRGRALLPGAQPKNLFRDYFVFIAQACGLVPMWDGVREPVPVLQSLWGLNQPHPP